MVEYDYQVKDKIQTKRRQGQMNADQLKVHLELSLEELTTNKYDVVLLPKDDVNEAFRIVDKLKDELLVKKLVAYVSDVINKHKDEMIKNVIEDEDEDRAEDVKIPHSIRLEFEESWNDGDATYPTISSMAFYDKDGNYVDGEELWFTYEYEVTWGNEKGQMKTSTSDLREYVREGINDNFYIEDLEKLIDGDKLELNIN